MSLENIPSAAPSTDMPVSGLGADAGQGLPFIPLLQPPGQEAGPNKIGQAQTIYNQPQTSWWARHRGEVALTAGAAAGIATFYLGPEAIVNGVATAEFVENALAFGSLAGSAAYVGATKTSGMRPNLNTYLDGAANGALGVGTVPGLATIPVKASELLDIKTFGRIAKAVQPETFFAAEIHCTSENRNTPGEMLAKCGPVPAITPVLRQFNQLRNLADKPSVLVPSLF